MPCRQRTARRRGSPADRVRTGNAASGRRCAQRKEEPLGLSDDQLNFAFGVAEGAVRGATKGQYPAPLAALRAIRDGINRPLPEGLKIELESRRASSARRFRRRSIGVFFMQNQLARDRGVDRSQRQAAAGQPRRRVGRRSDGSRHRHGARPFGDSHRDGRRRRQADRRRTASARPTSLAAASRSAAPRWPTCRRCCRNLGASTSHQAFADRDVVIEAVTENEELKTSLYRQLAPVLKKDAILATNTSTISITRMAEAWPDPTRFIGMHFFLPVDRMQLVEVIRGKTDERRDGRDDRRTVEADQEDADRRQRLCRLPRQPHPVALHDRGAGALARRRVDGRDRPRRHEVRHARRSDRAAGHGGSRHVVLCGQGAGRRLQRSGPQDHAVGRFDRRRPAGQEIGGRLPQIRRHERQAGRRPGLPAVPRKDTARPSEKSRTRRSRTGCSCRCCSRRSARSKRGSSASRRTSTWA